MKNLVLVISIVFVHMFCVVATADTLQARDKHGHHDYHLYYHHQILYYLTFLAIKVKLVLVVGTIFTIITFAGKLFALVKYLEHTKHDHHGGYESKIYFQSPHKSFEPVEDHHDFPGPHEVEEPYRRYSAINIDSMNKNKKFGQDLNGYKRSATGKSFFSKLFALMMRLNLTDTIFREMKLERTDCRKKFVCETQWIAENSSLFKVAMKLMSDSTFESYKRKNGTRSIEECRKLYPNCEVA
ncbi:hypothetical protein WA026_013347 [Henosepilachna vigintioctopunctata]|uniref:Uncharacterized protein n=1 Tax=Henosepilachna vigintioctopunctata TaxID=420089 RepID=A0AAW1VFS8_9CUCU